MSSGEYAYVCPCRAFCSSSTHKNLVPTMETCGCCQFLISPGPSTSQINMLIFFLPILLFYIKIYFLDIPYYRSLQFFTCFSLSGGQ